MATVSSHTLSAVDGTHAGGIEVRLINLNTGQTLFDTTMDQGGRLLQDVRTGDPTARYELVFNTGAYWQNQDLSTRGTRIMDEIVIRFSMPDPDGRYHIPLIISPHGYSLWSSTEHG